MEPERSKLEIIKPYLLAVGVVVFLLLVILLWPSSPVQEETETPVDEPVAVLDPVVEDVESDETGITDMIMPEVFEPSQLPTPVTLDANQESQVEEFQAEEVVEEIEVDTSDASVKSELMLIAESPLLGLLLENERLLQKFVINVHSMSERELPLNDSLFQAPTRGFETYEQGGKTWVDRASFARYTPYVEVLESIDLNQLISVYNVYKPNIEARFAEISRPGASFDEALLLAIDELLDTPRLPIRIEVYSDSVAYKYRDQRIENLSAPQKQLLRMGPDNMRRVKVVLRNLKVKLQTHY